MVSFPKPHKPGNYAARSESFKGEVYTYDPFWESSNTEKYEFSALTGEGRRTYGSGIPSQLAGWKDPSYYQIWGQSIERPGGVTEWTHEWGMVTRRETGPTSDYAPAAYGSKFFEATGVGKGMDFNTRQRLNTELMLKVGARRASLGESLAESHKTANHLAKTVSDLARAALAARKGRWGDVARHLGVPKKPNQVTKNLSERWLEYQYGWKPLMSDIHDQYKLFTEQIRKPQIMKSVRNLADHYDHIDTWGRFGREEYEEEAQYRAKVFYRVEDSALSRFHQIGLINPAEIAWALMPYSFVIDWFVPVGNVLEAMTSSFGTTFIGGYYGTRLTGRQKRQEDPGDGYRTTCTMQTRYRQVRRFSYVRETMSGYPIPGIYYKDPFSSSHITSALALIRQLSK